MSDLLLVASSDHVETWTLNRPEALNAFNRGLLEALNRELDRLEGAAPDSLPRCIVLTGAGERSFSAGADLKERKTMAPGDVPGFVTLIGGTMTRIAQCAVPVIAAVHGFAFGGGMEAALACDLRVVGPGARLGLTETRLGIIPGAGGTQRLTRLLGTGGAKSLILTGRRIDAAEAFRMGLAEFETSVEGRQGTLDRALEVATEVASCGPVAIRAAKDAIDAGLDMPLADALLHERACYDRTLGTEDRLEALAAFAEKRPPVFRGR
ncbi:MAG: enoyl-CoA hydratase-related protein [Myxococcota bacterium]|nr:enoyl-CoA hydratase-related protein [Myxococcota bacterium]